MLIAGGVFIHRKDVDGNNRVRLGIQFGEAGNGSSFLQNSPTELNLGPSATSPDFQLALGYDGASHVLSVAMYDAAGVMMDRVSADLDASPGGLIPNLPNTVQTMLSALAVTHAGWADFAFGPGGSVPNT